MDTEAKRFRRNYLSFDVAYTMMGVMVGLVFGVFITYLSIVMPGVAAYYSLFLGLGMLGAAVLATLAPKIGYKKMFIITPFIMVVCMLSVINSSNTALVTLMTFLFIVFICLYDVMFAPYMAYYTTDDIRDHEINRTTIYNIVGATVGTFLGGPLIVWLMSSKLGISYGEASALTETLETLGEAELGAYVESHRQVILMFVVFSVLMVIPALFMKEKKSDFDAAEDEASAEGSADRKSSIKAILSLEPVVFMIFMGLINFGASLMTPYVQVYMLSIGISRDAASIVASVQYIVIFAGLIFITPWLTRKFGLVRGIAFSCLAAVPFMIICANGRFFGGATLALVAIGVCARYTLYYAANPMMTSFETVVVPKEHVAFYVSVVFVVMSIGNTLAGLFGGALLFNRPNGYSEAYYVGALFFAGACIMLLAVMGKKYKDVKGDEVQTEEPEYIREEA